MHGSTVTAFCANEPLAARHCPEKLAMVPSVSSANPWDAAAVHVETWTADPLGLSRQSEPAPVTSGPDGSDQLWESAEVHGEVTTWVPTAWPGASRHPPPSWFRNAPKPTYFHVWLEAPSHAASETICGALVFATVRQLPPIEIA